MRFFSLLPLLAACQLGTDCTLIGCDSRLTLHITGAGDVLGLGGAVIVGGHTFVVDCAGTSDPEVICQNEAVVIHLSDGQGGGEVQWSLAADGNDTGRQGYAGEGTFTPHWTMSEPNGPDCGPTCWNGVGEVELLGTP